MTENPRLFLAGFWALAALRSFSDAVNAHTVGLIVFNIAATVACPILAYGELRRGLAERKARVKT